MTRNTDNKTFKLTGIALAAGLFMTGTAWGATATTTLLVSATVLDSCIVLATPLAFGTYGGSQADATASLSVTCTGTTAYAVTLDGGGSGNINARTMSSATDVLAYQLYTDSGRTTVFGDGTTGSNVTGTGSGLLQAVTVYGRIAAGTVPDAGAYTDTINVTVTY